MKYNFLQSLIPEGEHFDESAIVNEGGWMSIKHLDLINSKGNELTTSLQQMTQTIADNATAMDALVNVHTAAIDGLNVTIADKDKMIGDLTTASGEKDTTIADLQGKITALESKVIELGGQSSGPGTTLTVTEDVQTEKPATSTGKLPRYDDAEHPANKGADQFLSSKKQTETVRF